MLLKSIQLSNFRQYKGENLIEFSTDADKNVTAVLGVNTSGKTTLVQAFNWILYGKINFNTKDLLNHDVRIKLNLNESAIVKGILVLIHNDIEYTIERKQNYLCVSKDDIRPGKPEINMYEKLIDGQTKAIDGDLLIETAINKILPEGLSSYFFFDGERINRISDKSDVSNSVKGLMGLDVLESSRDHLAKVIKNLEKSLDLAGNEKAEQLQNRIENYENQLESMKKKKDEVDGEIEFYNSERDKLRTILNENEEVEELQREREQALSEAEILKKDYNDTVNNLMRNFNDNIYTFFGQPLFKKAEEILRETDYKVEGLSGLSVIAIDEIIERGYCVCGAPISHGTVEHDHLLKERRLLPPESIGTLVKNYRNDIDRFYESGSKYYKDLEGNYKFFRANKRSLGTKEEEIEILNKKLYNRKDLSHVTDQLRHYERMIRDKTLSKEHDIREVGRITKDLELAKKYRDSLIETNKKNIFVNACRKYAENLYDWVDQAYTEKESQIRENLEDSVNDIFSKIYHGKRTIKIDKNYKISYSDVKTDESSGLETVKNFAFIAGLVDLGRRKLNPQTEDEIDLGSEPYPLVMDAPFSTADEKHVSNISRLMPSVAEQVIMVLMQKDWAYAERELGQRVGRIYQINKLSETHSTIEQEV